MWRDFLAHGVDRS